MGNKKTREIVGYTFQKQQENHELWYSNALGFNEASLVLHKNQDEISQGLKIFLYNAALSLELMFKAILAAKGEVIPASHILINLCAKSKVNFDEDKKCTLELLTECFLWLSRYPAPTSEKRWGNYHDVIVEKHKICSKSGNTYTTRGNPKRFPSLENYEYIWDKCSKKYYEIIKK